MVVALVAAADPACGPRIRPWAEDVVLGCGWLAGPRPRRFPDVLALGPATGLLPLKGPFWSPAHVRRYRGRSATRRVGPPLGVSGSSRARRSWARSVVPFQGD